MNVLFRVEHSAITYSQDLEQLRASKLITMRDSWLSFEGAFINGYNQTHLEGNLTLCGVSQTTVIRFPSTSAESLWLSLPCIADWVYSTRHWMPPVKKQVSNPIRKWLSISLTVVHYVWHKWTHLTWRVGIVIYSLQLGKPGFSLGAREKNPVFLSAWSVLS